MTAVRRKRFYFADEIMSDNADWRVEEDVHASVAPPVTGEKDPDSE